MKDGWHVIAGYNVYVEGDKITHGTLGEGTSNYRTAWPYRWIGGPTNAWSNCAGLTVSAFRAGVKRGTIRLK